MVFNTNLRLMQVKSFAECSKGSILQYFRPFLRYQLSLRSLFCLFLSDHSTQVLLCLFISHTDMPQQNSSYVGAMDYIC